MKELLTIQDAIRKLPVTERGLRWLVRQRKIGHSRIGRRLFFSQEDIDAFIESRHVQPGGRHD